MASLVSLKVFIIALLEVISSSAQPLEARTVQRPLLSELPCSSDFGFSGELLGLMSGAIPDSDITASSSWNASYSASSVRIFSGSSWSPRVNENQWIQVDLGVFAAITGVIIYSDFGEVNYIKTFTVQHSTSGAANEWQNLTDEVGQTIQFEVSSEFWNGMTVISFPDALFTRFIRLSPTAWVGHIRLNMEFTGCRDIDGMLRLVGGDGHSGRVEVLKGGTWGVICDNGWDDQDADVVCQQFGLNEMGEATSLPLGEGEEAPFLMSRVTCRGTETRLVDCPLVCGSESLQCNSSRAAGVSCKPPRDVIRLVGGSSPTNGRVEIYQNNTWGTLCDTYWDVTDADIVCRQLGFSGAEEAKSGAHFGQGVGPVHMDGLACDGSESRISDCPSLCWEGTRCNHTQDAGVVCREGATLQPKESTSGSGLPPNEFWVFTIDDYFFFSPSSDWIPPEF